MVIETSFSKGYILIFKSYDSSLFFSFLLKAKLHTEYVVEIKTGVVKILIERISN